MISSVNFAQPDVTLKLDLAGVILGVALSNAVSNEPSADWVGRHWADTVAAGGNAQVRRMLEDARASGVSSFSQVRQRFPSGLEIAVEYTAVRLGADAGLLAIGRNLEAVGELRSRLIAAQESMERDYWKLRDVETRYRLLFDASAQPVLLVGADDIRVKEANPAAIRALGVASDSDLLPEILASQREMFDRMLARLREHGRAPGVIMNLGPDRQAWLVRASLIASEAGAVIVLQLSPSGAVGTAVDRGGAFKLEDVIARLPEGFVAVDAEGKIVRVNRAFINLVEHTVEGAVLGQRLGRWVSEPGTDDLALLGKIRSARSLSPLAATIRGELGAQTEVEISAAGDADVSPRFFGLVVRPRSPRDAGARPQEGSVAELVGKLSLREIIKGAVSSVERQCIDAALSLANGNRTVAAQTLGMSRQSLHTKLNRFSSDTEEQDSK